KSNFPDIKLLNFECGRERWSASFTILAEFHAERAHGGGGLATRLFQVINAAGNRAAFGAIEQGGFLADGPIFIAFQAGEIERAPAERLTGLNDLVKAFALAFTQPNTL